MTCAPTVPVPALSLHGESRLAVLVSGGLDSAVLLAEEAREHAEVIPLYVRFGLFWEEAELFHLRRFLEALVQPCVRPLQLLDLPVEDLYGGHWSLTGVGVPGLGTPDEAVFLPGRNLLLLGKALLWCHLRGVPAVALGLLRDNPFPDARPTFFTNYEALVEQAIGTRVRILQPYRDLSKADVLRRGRDLPLQWTFSCIRPVFGRHCGGCNKCAERRRAFAEVGLPDPAPSLPEGPCSA